MKDKFNLIKNIVIVSLLILLGVVVGYRFALTDQLPLGIKSAWLSNQASNWLAGSTARTNKTASKNNSVFSAFAGDKAKSKANMDTFWEVWGYLESDYLDQEKLDSEQMVHGAIAGMTASLGDPYTVYLPPVSNQRSGEDLAGSFYGIGIELGYTEGILSVLAPLDGTPAAKAGVLAGDLILKVKDEATGTEEETTGWSLDQAVNKIRGKKGTAVKLTLLRKDYNNNQTFEASIVRDEIIVKSVELAFVESGGKTVAHLKLIRFGERTLTEWDAAVQDILAKKANLSGIILDMRNNPGGFFDTSIDLASDFIPKGKVVVSQKDKLNQTDFKSKGGERLANLPLIVLVNRGSASASEILAGALRDDLGVKLVGEKTYGKGTVQDRRELSNGGGVHITIGRWLLPSGAWIHEEGIPVDVEAEQNYETEEDEVLQKALGMF